MPDDTKVLNIAEKVRFWEEQDRINQALIPRVMEMHEVVLELHKRTADISAQIAATEARVFERVLAQSRQTTNAVRLAAYGALALAAIACTLSLYQLLT